MKNDSRDFCVSLMLRRKLSRCGVVLCCAVLCCAVQSVHMRPPHLIFTFIDNSILVQYVLYPAEVLAIIPLFICMMSCVASINCTNINNYYFFCTCKSLRTGSSKP